jgi:hypothetical protein
MRTTGSSRIDAKAWQQRRSFCCESPALDRRGDRRDRGAAACFACGFAFAGTPDPRPARRRAAERGRARLAWPPTSRRDRTVDAAYTAMANRSFYDVTLKNFAMPWTNRDQTVFAPLNDYVATVIGMVRDDVAFNTAAYDDILYTGGTPGEPAYSASTTTTTRRSSRVA